MPSESQHSDEQSGFATLPLFPLHTVLLPGAHLPLHVFEPRYRQLTVEPSGSPQIDITQMEFTVGIRRYFVTSADKWKRKGGILSFGE